MGVRNHTSSCWPLAWRRIAQAAVIDTLSACESDHLLGRQLDSVSRPAAKHGGEYPPVYSSGATCIGIRVGRFCEGISFQGFDLCPISTWVFCARKLLAKFRAAVSVSCCFDRIGVSHMAKTRAPRPAGTWTEVGAVCAAGTIWGSPARPRLSDSNPSSLPAAFLHVHNYHLV
jgi:hypothetical protein